MQTLKRKWHGKDTVKKAVLIIGFVFVLVLAFASAFNYQQYKKIVVQDIFLVKYPERFTDLQVYRNPVIFSGLA